jgi:hypothetical protein
MNEEHFNMELRKFLKRFGVGAQQVIEQAARQSLAAGAPHAGATLRVRARLEIEGTDDVLVIDERLPLT